MPGHAPKKFTDAALVVLAIAIGALLFERQRSARTEELIRGVETQRVRLAERRERLERDRQSSAGHPPKPAQPSGISPAAAASHRERLKALQLDKMRADTQLDYGALFHALGLSPRQIGQFIEARTKYRQEIEAIGAKTAAMKSSPNDPALAALQVQAEQDNDQFNRDLRGILGESGLARFNQYQGTMGMRTLADQLASDVYYTDSPLSGPQAEQLTQILAANAAGKHGQSGQISAWDLDWDTAIAQARSILSPTQIATFQTIKDNDLLWQKVNKITRPPSSP